METTKSFYRFALITVWLGALIGLTTGIAKGAVTEHYPVVLIVVSILAALASIPVYRQYKGLEA